MDASVFDKIRLSAGSIERSVQWYRSQISKLGTLNVPKTIREGNTVNAVIPGEMYLYVYNPKMHEQLPYYDIFPLVIPFRRKIGGFIGINIHYLPYAIRMNLLKQLSFFATDARNDQDTRIKLSWRLIESSIRFLPAKACVKHYLLEHVKSRFLKIPYPDWVIASQLPIEGFMKEQKNVIWRENRNKYLNV